MLCNNMSSHEQWGDFEPCVCACVCDCVGVGVCACVCGVCGGLLSSRVPSLLMMYCRATVRTCAIFGLLVHVFFF